MSQASPAAALAGDAPAPARGVFLQTPLGQDTFARYNNDDNVVQWELFQSSPLRKDRLTVHFMLDMQYRIIRATPNVHNLTGFAQDLLTAVSPHFVSFAHPKDVASIRQNLFEAASLDATGPAAGYIFQSRNQIAQRHRIATAFGRYTWVETVYAHSAIGEPCLLLLCSPIDPPAEDEDWMCEGELMARSFNLNIDLSRSVVWVSPACTILGFNCLQLLWVDVLDIVHPRDRERFKHAIDSHKDVVCTRISMIVDIVHGQGVYVRCSVLMESGVLMSDDQKHPWRFILANCSVLDTPMPELSVAARSVDADLAPEDDGAGRPMGFEYDASGSTYQTQPPPPYGTQPYYQHEHQQPADPDHPASQYASYTSLPDDVLDAAEQDLQMYNWRLMPRNLKVDPAEYEDQLAQRLGNAEPHMALLDDGLLIAEQIRSIYQTSPTLAHQQVYGSVSMPPSATLLGTPTSASSSTSPGTAGTGHSLLHASSADDLSGGLSGFEASVSYGTMPQQQLLRPALATLSRRASSSSHDATGTVRVRKPKATPGHARSNSAPALKLPADAVATPQTDEDEPQKKDKKKSVYRPSRRRDKICEICGRNESPEWRRGPTGHNSLCNACGIRFAKFVKSGCPPEQAIARMLRRAESDDSLVMRPQLTVTDFIMSPRTDDATPHPRHGHIAPMMSPPPSQQQSSA